MSVVVDTHALIWYLTGNPRLSETVRRLLNRADTDIVIPVIVLAEIKHLHDRQRIAISYDAVVAKLRSDPRCTIQPLEPSVLDLLPKGLELHDGIIVAAALHIARETGVIAKVATRDEQIMESGLVPTIW